ncbi:MAG TPA: ImmA/IrrE family metallo-endopeptidase [Pyrinomonadaceae bacterium]|nr:ImmA/IrrE family metallo-endopeptidase [Pyrinomonadaceae bacterium]
MQLLRVRKTHIKQLVKKILIENNIQSPYVRIEDIVKNIGIELIEEDANDDIAGFLIKNYDEKTAIIGVNKNHKPNRRRFTIAHELGHFFLHNYEGVHFDGKHSGSQMFLRDEKSTKGTDIEEREANLFAAELLMPEILLQKDIAKINEIYFIDEDPKLKKLASDYRVSTQALTFRLANLGYLTL